MKITTMGIDLAKALFQVHGVDTHGKVGLRKQLKRKDVVSFFANLEPCLIGMEACGSAHYWARNLSALGHTVRLMAPQFVKPYVKTNKSDRNDAEAICEAVGRPNMRFVSASLKLDRLHRSGTVRRLAPVTGCAAAIPDVKFGTAWVSDRQIADIRAGLAPLETASNIGSKNYPLPKCRA